MKRALPWILIVIVGSGAALGLYSLGRREHGAAPSTQTLDESPLFTCVPAGAGVVFKPQIRADQPLRTMHFMPPMRGGLAAAQVLTQTGDQLLARFQGGAFIGASRVLAPDTVPAAFFRFAQLLDLAPMEDGSLLLLYGDGTGAGADPWLIAFDPATQSAKWALKASGDRIALEPGSRACLLWSGKTLARATWGAAPSLTPIPLPDGVGAIDEALAAADDRVFVAYPGGLAINTGGVWKLSSLPDPGQLSFPGAPSALAISGKIIFWSPRPGQLERIAEDGGMSAVDLSTLTAPVGRAMDLSMLTLGGVDPKGRLWFTLAAPDLSISPHANLSAEPSAALPTEVPATSSSSAALATVNAFDPAPWLDYVKTGLDRAYIWKPGDTTTRMIDWTTQWPTLGAPADISMPLPRDVRPESGALLLRQDAESWWLPLDKVAP